MNSALFRLDAPAFSGGCPEIVELYRQIPLADPQNQIRVLALNPATDYKDDIQCELEVIDVPQKVEDNNRGDYEAVSYAWGDISLTHRAYIGRRPLAITANLDVALRHLRHYDWTRRLWIDGICIDQSNSHEKSYQVQMLRRTFRYAFQSLIWLGVGDSSTDYAIRRLNELAHLKRQNDRRISIQCDVDQVGDEALNEGLREIFARPWWTRL